MPNLAAVVFDMDGTLFDSWQVVTDAFIATVLKAGGDPYSPQEVIDAFRFGPPRAILEHLIGRATDTDLADYHSRIRRDAWSVRPYPGMLKAIEGLAASVPVAIFSGADLESVDILLAATDLRPYFKAVVGGDEVAEPKPAPDGLLLACSRLGVKPADAAYVGDSALDVGAARAAGMLAVAASWGHLDTSDADLVVDRPDDLLRLVP
ncbi:MAG: HAD family hydrolase [Actinobacteria bacterium]|nr:HAD family hydrolase [Actinomycetota bacterium]